jgi:hypothetical protein
VIDEYSGIDSRVIYQHPLAYLLGLEGVALLRAFSGIYDRDFTLARFREIQALLDSAEELGAGVEARPITTREGYDQWAPVYDEPGNELLDIEQPIVREILDGPLSGSLSTRPAVPAATPRTSRRSATR